MTVLLPACAGTDVRPIAPGEDWSVDGIRYYEAAPFLLVYTDGKGGLKSEIKFLPDTTTKRSIDPFAVLAQNNTTLSFTNGVLTQSKVIIDETGVPKAIVTALEKVATAAMGAANAPGDPAKQTDLPLPRLYRIVIDKDSVSLEGGRAFGPDNNEIHTISATISAATAPAPTPATAAPAPTEPKDGEKKKEQGQ